MHIGIIAVYIRGADSIGLQLIEWAGLFRNHGHTVRIFVEQIGRDVPPELLAITTVTHERTLVGGPDWTWLNAADVVICDYPAYYGLAECVRLLAGPAIVFSYHGVTPPERWPDGAGRAYLERSRRRTGLVHFADIAVTRSGFTRDELRTLTNFPTEQMRLIPCLVPEPPTLAPASDTITPRLLSVGRLAGHKRPELLVDALAHLRREMPATQLVLAGDARGPSHTPVVARVRERAAMLGVADVVLCTGSVDQDLLEHLYAHAGVLVSTSAHEGFCVPVIEAMARGVPVVAMATSALPETVGDAGILIADGDTAALSQAIQAVLTDTALRRTLIERGYARAQQYRPAAIAAPLLALVEQLPERTTHRAGLPRLSQSVDLHRLLSMAEVTPETVPPPRKLPFLRSAAARLRRWFQSDLLHQIDVLQQRQVAFNREVARALQELDELSADLSEREAAQRHAAERHHQA